MLHVDILLYSSIVDITVGNVLIDLVKLLHCTSEGPMVLVVPVIELHSIDMTAVQELHFRLDDTGIKLVLSEISHKTVAREHCPVT